MSKGIVIGGIVVAALLVLLLVAVKGNNRDSSTSSAKGAAKPGGESSEPAANSVGQQRPTLAGSNASNTKAGPANRLPGLREKFRNEIEDRARSAGANQDLEAMRAAAEQRQKVGPALQTSSRAYRSGQFTTALDEAESILAHSPKTRRARMLATLSACALGQAERAIEHARRLDSAGVLRAAEACEEHGIDMPEDILRKARIHKPRVRDHRRE